MSIDNVLRWVSNKRELFKEIPDSDFEMGELPVERALGMQWNIELDKFQYKIILSNKPFTRKGILSIVSSIYDPVGFVSLVIFRAKLTLQRLCHKKLG